MSQVRGIWGWPVGVGPPWWFTSIQSLVLTGGQCSKMQSCSSELTYTVSSWQKKKIPQFEQETTTDTQACVFMTCDQHMSVADLRQKLNYSWQVSWCCTIDCSELRGPHGYNVPTRLDRSSPFTPSLGKFGMMNTNPSGCTGFLCYATGSPSIFSM